MERWEYLVRVFELDKEDEVVVDYVTREYPDISWKEMPKHDPLTLEAWLNKCGEEGWELIAMEPADKQGKKGEIGLTYQSATYTYRRIFLCVFRRPRAS